MNKNYLSLDIVKRMADSAEKKAIENKVKVSISILDNHGNLKYFRRMDDSNYGSIRISQLKAQTSASFPISSQELSERSAKIPTNPFGEIPDVVLLRGGLPILSSEGQHIGAIGVSGATSEVDELCGQAGINAVKELI